MSVTKRTRYEVLRRDGHKCRYCGLEASETELTVDHVIPVSLGGADTPDNLVAACRDCNAGKASSNPDAELVEDVEALALRYRNAMIAVAKQRREQKATIDRIVGTFWDAWAEVFGSDTLAHNWRTSIERFLINGLSLDDLLGFIDVTDNAEPWRGKEFRYFCGCCWTEIKRRQELALKMIEEAD